MTRSDVLDPREAKFVDLYFENPNGTQAAIAAGYTFKPKSAAVQASLLLKRAKIQKALAAKSAKFMQRYEVTPDRLIREFAKIAFSNTDDFVSVQSDGSVILDFGTATREQFAALASIEVDEQINLGDGDEPQAVKIRKTKFKHYDKLKALSELAKLSQMYPAERSEITGANGGPIQTANLNLHKIDIASLEPAHREQLRGMLLALKRQAGDNGEESE